jgi:hypothetical protein
MGAPNSKQQSEQAAFSRFTERLGTQSDWINVSNRQPPEPDLLCVHIEHGPIAFELVSLTDPAIAEIQAAGAKALQSAFSTSDPSERIIKDKLHKEYVTDGHHIELLIFTEGQLITPDDVIIPTILPWFDAIPHPFKRAWFMGEFRTFFLWEAS